MPEQDATQDAQPEQDAILDEQLAPHAIPALRQVTNAIQPDELPNAPLEPHAMPAALQDEPRPHCAQPAELLRPAPRHGCRQQPRYALARSSAVPQPWLQDGHGSH